MGALLTQIMNKYAYTDFHELNVDWMIRTMMELINQVENFVSLNAIKYADPIQWNITQQYEKNTVVIDPLTGTAYISVQPVPMGVALTNTNYWTVVFDLGSFVVRAAKNFSNHYEDETTLTATFPSIVDQWLVWGDTLYVVISPIVAGDQYVVNSNIKRITVEEVCDALAQAIQNIQNNVGNLDNLSTTDKTNIVAAINEVVTNIGALSDLTTTDQSNIVNAINEVVDNVTTNTSNISAINLKISNMAIKNVKDFGAVGDGVTDDTAAINSALAGGGVIYFPDGVYLIDGMSTYLQPVEGVGVVIESNSRIILANDATVKQVENQNGTMSSIFTLYGVENVEISGGKLQGDLSTHVFDSPSEWGHCINVIECKNVYIHDMELFDFVGDGVYVGQGRSFELNHYNGSHNHNVHLENLNIHDGSRNGIAMCDCDKWTINDIVIDNVLRTAPKSGIDVEPEGDISPAAEVSSGVIYNINATNTYYGIAFTNSNNTISLQNIISGMISAFKSTNIKVHDCHGNRVEFSANADAEIAFYDCDFSSIYTVDASNTITMYNCKMVCYQRLLRGILNLYNCYLNATEIFGNLYLKNCTFAENLGSYILTVHGSRAELDGCCFEMPTRLHRYGILNALDAGGFFIVKNQHNNFDRSTAALNNPFVSSATNAAVINCDYAPFSGEANNLDPISTGNYYY